jgi:CDP-6-deoxy-D-xylo-4-hexulose-3-dehydrase
MKKETNSTNAKKELIYKFLEEAKKLSFVPEYCHNLKNNKKNLYYSGPLFDDEEVVEAIDSLLFGKWLSSGEKVRKFEIEFSKFVNQKHSVMVNSGSSANLVLIAALKKYFDWKDNSEIIISVVGFPTTLNPILQNNLKPVFVDIEFNTLNFCLNEIEKQITPNTKAIFVSPMLGSPPDIDKLTSICKKHNLQLVLDGCDSLGSKWNNRHLNEYAIASSCSFYPAHHITTGEGGMVTSNIEEIVDLARSFSWWGRDCYCTGSANLTKCGTCNCRFSRWIQELPYDIDHKYFFTQIGYNLKPLDLQGGIGLAQLKKAKDFCSLRKKYKKEIQEIISTIKGVTFPVSHDLADVSWFGVPIICDSFAIKAHLVNYLEQNGIQTRNYFAGNILLHPAYRHLDNWKSYPLANNILERVFFIGCSPTLSEDNIEHLKTVINAYEN